MSGASETWEQRRLDELRRERLTRLKEDVARQAARERALQEALRRESLALADECRQEVSEAMRRDCSQYRKGLRLMYIGTMLHDDDLKAVGRAFIEKFH